jgi:hypothetical protein
MVRIRTRDQLLNWLEDDAARLNRRSVVRAFAEGAVEVLGGFNTDPPCWIIKMRGINKVWKIAVFARTNGYGWKLLDRVPWEKWVGGNSPLYRGDFPERYANYGKRCE